jgi:hypothetical protein
LNLDPSSPLQIFDVLKYIELKKGNFDKFVLEHMGEKYGLERGSVLLNYNPNGVLTYFSQLIIEV